MINAAKATFVRLAAKEVESWTNRNLPACLSLCVNAKDFTCRAVNHSPDQKVANKYFFRLKKVDNSPPQLCALLEHNVGQVGGLEEDLATHHYERISTAVTCGDEDRCRW